MRSNKCVAFPNTTAHNPPNSYKPTHLRFDDVISGVTSQFYGSATSFGSGAAAWQLIKSLNSQTGKLSGQMRPSPTFALPNYTDSQLKLLANRIFFKVRFKISIARKAYSRPLFCCLEEFVAHTHKQTSKSIDDAI